MISNWFAARILDTTFNGVAWTAVEPWLALHTADPGAGGLAATEVSGGSYGRKKPDFPTPTANSLANSTAAVFTGLPAVTLTHIAIWSAAAGGNMLFYGPLATSVVIAAGKGYTVAASDFAVTLT